ncbi:hypothetical protein BJV77DRAFT_1062367 [Russula vinacea]|nr:hypothetical protein BJV77DRAFT_1062367 [Russula vinacea]
MLCRQGQSGLVNCSRLRETFLMKVVHPEWRRWNFGAEILLNAFQYLKYAPYRLFMNDDGTNQCWDEMATSSWWWDIQEVLPNGATVAPVILASDKTQLTVFSGDKQAWPTMLVGYLPVTKLECFTEKRRSNVGYQLFHQCMESLLEPLKMPGKIGLAMTLYPILVAYIANFPEQCLVACCMESRCPRCLVKHDERGSSAWSDPRNHKRTVKLLKQRTEGLKSKVFVSQGLRPVKLFWANLPHTDIFQCFTPDIHHQLHKGIFKDHFVAWCTEAVDGGSDEVNHCFKSMTKHTSLRHFNKGISLVSQWTGNKYKNMEKIFLGVIAGTMDEWVIQAVQAVVDFISYARFEVHTENSLERIDRAWSAIHENKKIFLELHIHENFNIPKFHSLIHYVSTVRSHGTLDEHLHIDFTKVPFRAGEGIIDSEEDSEDDDEDDAKPKRKQRLGGLASLASCSYEVVKIPGYGNVSMDTLVNKFGASDSVSDFIWYLEEFLLQHSLPIPSPALHNVPFGVFKRLSVMLPQIPQASDLMDLRDTIRMTLPEPSQARRKAVPAQFDTVLAFEKAGLTAFSDPSNPLKGLSVAQVRAIFQLPQEYSQFDTPLAYVEWYTPLQSYVPSLGMYQISRSF